MKNPRCFQKPVVAAMALLGCHVAFADPITLPGDPVIGVRLQGNIISVAVQNGHGSGSNGYWEGEPPANAIDVYSNSRYRNSAGPNTGIIVNPGNNTSPINAIQLVSGDNPTQDPTSFSIYGTNVAQSTNFANYTPIVLNQPVFVSDPGREKSSGVIRFQAPSVAYDSYLVVFPTVRTSTEQMQIGEIELRAQRAAGTPPPVPNAIPNATQVPGTLLYRSPEGESRITNIIYHNGNVYTNLVGGGGNKAWKWSNPNDARSFGNAPNGGHWWTEHGNHGHTKSSDFAAGRIKRHSVGVNLSRDDPQRQETNIDGPNNTRSGAQIYFPWTVPFHWIQYAGLNNPEINYSSFISRGGQTLVEWDALGEAGVTGTHILFGNLMFVISDNTDQGILCYDISPVFKTPAQKPILLDKLTGSYGSYLPALWENHIILARPGTHTRDGQQVEVIDFSDPTDLRHVASINTKGTDAKFGNASAWYIQAQDNFIFTQHQKIDMNTFKVVLELDQVGDSRPPGSATGKIDTSQYLLPLGNLLLSGGYSFTGEDCLGVWAHQAAPDTKKPYVGYHMPRPGQTNYPLGAPISLLIHETLESYTIINGETVILREVGTTTPLDCWTSFSHDDILTITPKQYLQANKTYEVVLVANGIKDPVGNGMEPYRFTFSTGTGAAGGNASPTINSFTANASPVSPNTSVTLNVSATDPEGDALQYRFNFGDGTDTTAWGSATSAAHTYTTAGHFDAKVQVRETKPDGSITTVSKTYTVTVANTIPGPLPTHSSTVALDRANRRVWVSNSDSDTVSILNADTNAKVSEFNLNSLLGISTSIDPRGIAIDGSGNAWVACHDADRIAVINSSGGLVRTISPGYGSTPIGVAITPDGTSAFVTLMGKGLLKRYAVSGGAETGSLNLGPTPRAIAITGDGTRVLVTRFLADVNHGMVWDVANTATLSLNRTYLLHRDRNGDGASNGRGIPNHLTGITISPDNTYAWITGTKHHDQNGTFFKGAANTDNIARAVLVRLRLNENQEAYNNVDRIDVDNSDSPTGVVFSPRGDWAFTTLQGNNDVGVFDDINLRALSVKQTKWRFATDLAPQGLVFDPNTNKLFVNNFMSRTVTVHNLTNFLASGDRSMIPTKVNTVATEKLSADVLAGKRIFYNATLKDSAGGFAISRDSYISCATCHLDGGQDGRVWDFTQRGEGLRNTIDLRGKSGMGHGNLHWSGNFDEVHDFENDIRSHFGGTGLISGATVSTSLGTSKAGLSTALDQLSAYVTSLNGTHIPASPHRGSDGSMTAAAVAGQAVFVAQNCASCHGGPQFTESTGGVGIAPTLRDVGTIRTSSGRRMGSALPGIDTPTLLGVHNSAPYFHDGSAPTLASVFATTGGTTYQAESGSVSGDAWIEKGLQQNNGASAHLDYQVGFGTSGSLTLSSVQGGAGGVGALDIRYTSGWTQTMTVTVNGTSHIYEVSGTGNEVGWMPGPNWLTARIDGVNLNAGTSNTIVITCAGTSTFAVDDITVSLAADLAKAKPHRRILSVSSTDQANLIAYLQQIDARSVDPLITLNPILTGAVGGSPAYSGSDQYAADKAFDEDVTTFFAPANSNSSAQLDMGSTRAGRVTTIRYYPRSGFNYRMNGGKFQGSTDGSAWTDLHVISGSPPEQWTSISINNTTYFRYLRYVQPTDLADAAEIEFRGLTQTSIGTALQAFRTTHGLAADGSQDLLKPANDGVASLLKYAFNMIGSGAGQKSLLTSANSTIVDSAGAAGLPRIGRDESGRLTLTYIRRKTSGNPGVSYAVEFNNSMGSGSWATNSSATESATSIDSTFERVTLTDSVANAGKRFARVRVTSL